MVAGGSVTPGPVGAMRSTRDTGGNPNREYWNAAFNEEWTRSHDAKAASMYANSLTGNQQFQLPQAYEWPHPLRSEKDPSDRPPGWGVGYHKLVPGIPGMETPLTGRYPAPDAAHRWDADWNQRWNQLFNQEWNRTHSAQGAKLFADINMGQDPGIYYGRPGYAFPEEAKRASARTLVNPFDLPFEPWNQPTSWRPGVTQRL
jgi:hypothetical protein